MYLKGKSERDYLLCKFQYFKLKDILAVAGFPKATYMYWQKRIDRGNPKKNPLSKLFQIKELEALNFFLNDRQNGENSRNNVAHYLIESNELSEMNVIFSLDILIFVLLKVDYLGIVFVK